MRLIIALVAIAALAFVVFSGFSGELIPTPTATTGTAANIVELDPADDLESYVATNSYVLVDFHADWCGPCQDQGKILAQLAAELPGDRDIKIVKVNVDHHGQLAEQFAVRSIPALFVFQDGKLVDRNVGLASKDQIRNWLNLY